MGTGFDRIDLNSNLNVTPVKRLNVDLRFNASLMNRKRGEKSGRFWVSTYGRKSSRGSFLVKYVISG